MTAWLAEFQPAVVVVLLLVLAVLLNLRFPPKRDPWCGDLDDRRHW
jgi:hypothetical protein